MTDDERRDDPQDEHGNSREPAGLDDEAGDPAQAFEALREAVEAYGDQHTDELQQLRTNLTEAFLHFREYAEALDPSQDVGKIVQGVSIIEGRLADIEKSPLLKHGPDYYANAIERAGQNLVRNAVDKLDRQSGDLERIGRQLAGHVEGARQRRQQDRHVLFAGGIGAVFGILAILVLPWVLPAPVGMSVAATAMNSDRWNAGMALMKSGDAQTWNAFVDAHQFVRGNAPALADCRAAAEKSGKEQKCTVFVVPAQSQ